MNTLAYVFGQPGAGKTSLLRAVCDSASLLYEAQDPIKHRCFNKHGRLFSILGADAYPFGGTDTLSYTAINTADSWLQALSSCAAGKLVFGEGDRLANDKFFEVAQKHFRLKALYLTCPDDEAARRRTARASAHGLSLQATSWVRGRITKHANLAARHQAVIHLDARQSPDVLAKQVWAIVEQA